MFVWLQNKDEPFSMYISCIKDASVALKLPIWGWNNVEYQRW